jgi:hypothetical protein
MRALSDYGSSVRRFSVNDGLPLSNHPEQAPGGDIRVPATVTQIGNPRFRDQPLDLLLRRFMP